MKKCKEGKISLMVGAVGVVYGDIGTSPLYALKSCFSIGHLAVNEANVLGLISIFLWSLILVVTVKYVMVVMRADDEGEGGILVLATLCHKLGIKKFGSLAITLGLLGTALFFGDGVITPAISVLSALEGIQLVSPALGHHTVIIATIILAGLFIIQKEGSGRIGAYVGPIIIIWFLTLGILGGYNIIQAPHVLKALNPVHIWMFFKENGLTGFLTLGGAILVITGAEALYADIGHFGKQPIRLSWNYFVFPALALTYLGQGALLLHTPAAITHPFYYMAPAALYYPLVLLATCATVIASQAVITGVFSLCSQAIMLNYLPRMRVLHTSNALPGQVYLPTVNYILCFFTLTAVWGFKTSDNLAVAYGLNVSALMLVTTLFIAFMAHYQWQWHRLKTTLFFLPILSLDLIFVMNNLVKVTSGAWYTLLVTLLISYVLWVWRKGTQAFTARRMKGQQDLKDYIKKYKTVFRQRIPCTAIFLAHIPKVVPFSLVVHLKHNKYLHKKVLFITVAIENIPKFPARDRYSMDQIDPGIYCLTGHYGFKEIPDLQKILEWARTQGILAKDEQVSFFVSKGVPVASPRKPLSKINEQFYIFLSRISLAQYEFYKIPHEDVIELGIRYLV